MKRWLYDCAGLAVVWVVANVVLWPFVDILTTTNFWIKAASVFFFGCAGTALGEWVYWCRHGEL